MPHAQSYLTLRAGVEARGEVVDRKSRFIAQLVHIESEEDAAAHVAAVRARHFDARHNVLAWILADGTERASDDGEPQRTSGLPTLEVLRGAELRDVCCVTTRYFGGTLLGPGGLVRAYTAAAQAAIETARADGLIVENTLVAPVEVHLPYASLDQVRYMVAQAGGKIVDAAYAQDVRLALAFRAGEEAAFLTTVAERFSGRVVATAGEARFMEF